MRSIIAASILVGAGCLAMSAKAAVIGFDSGESSNYASFNVTTSGGSNPSTWAPGDWFGWGAYGAWAQPAGMPWAIADDSVVPVSGSIFAADRQGIVDGTYSPSDQTFSVADTVNPANPGGTATAIWEFDISGFKDISVAADFAAMGNFESFNDIYGFTYSIDGGPSQPLFTSSVVGGNQNYTMENGLIVNLIDPLLLNGIMLDDLLLTLSTPIVGTGSLLEINYTASTDGGDEAYLFDNLQVRGTTVPAPLTLALVGLGLAGIGYQRRSAGT